MKNNKKAYQKLFKVALATSVAAGAIVTVAPFNTEAAGFSDLKTTHAHYTSVMDLSDRGVIKGFTDGTFKPEASVTRGQAAKIIALTLGLDTKNVINPGFKDIKADNEYYGPIAALVAEGIVSGKENGTYAPGEKLTRSQMAKIITLAFGFKEGKLTDTKFKDVKATDWYNGYLQTLLDNEITTGTTATTFSPYDNVKRGQMASFVVRAEAAAKPVTVISVSDNSVETSAGTYTVAEDLKKVFNATNAAALKNANIKFTEKDGQIVAVKSLEITADGTQAANIVFDGASASITSDVKVNGDYVTVKNLTINGNLAIGKGVENSFLADKIVVKGNTEVSNKSTGVSAAAVKVDAKITFTNSTLGKVVLNKLNALLNLTGTSSVTSVNVESNATITADSNITIPVVTAGTGVSEVTLNAATKEFFVNALNFALNGTAKIESLELVNKDLKITLGTSLSIVDLVLPVGKVASELISNFSAVKDKIQEIGGVKNPDASPVTPPASGGGGGTGGDNGSGGGGTGTDYAPGNTLLNTTLSANVGAGNTNDLTVTLNESTNVFTVKISSNSTAVLSEFETAIIDVFTPLKNRSVVNSARVSFTAYGRDYVISDPNINNNQDVATIINNALNEVINTGITDQTALNLLIGNSLTISLQGTIDSKPFNTTYVFNFESK
ncbi:S-layer homology domain-containing protein [Psychrobacillus sp. FSL H8-0487]|uniref:S-layer homology domain-containing protein n=1 Tax=Psychrobacillus sp. FSL H8-0487 TaxID=2921391 RepID=UPI0030FCE3A5